VIHVGVERRGEEEGRGGRDEARRMREIRFSVLQ
jgi:hypothetical protein